MTKNDKQYRSYSYFLLLQYRNQSLWYKKNSWIKFCWTYPGFKGRSVIRPSSFRYKAIWWPYNGTWPYNGQKSLWPYKSRSSRFFKTPKGLVSDKRPWPYNRGNTVILNTFVNSRIYKSGKRKVVSIDTHEWVKCISQKANSLLMKFSENRNRDCIMI